MPAVLVLAVILAFVATMAQAVAALEGLSRRGRPAPVRETPAGKLLDEIAAILRPLRDAEVTAAARRFDAAARRLIAVAGARPSARAGARRHLTVLLTGMRDAARALAAGWGGAEHGTARDEFLRFLDELTQSYARLAEEIDRASHDALRLEIDVAREHLTLAGKPRAS